MRKSMKINISMPTRESARSWAATVRYRSKEFVNNHPISLATIILILTFVLAANFVIWQARPGELLFTMKLLNEKTFLNAESGNPKDRYNNQLAIVKDRVTAYLSVYREQECVKLHLSEAELWAQAQKLEQIARVTENRTNYSNYLYTSQQLYGLIKPIENISCQISPILAELQHIQQIELLKVAPEYANSLLGSNLESLKSEYDQIRAQIQTVKFTTQQQLTDINSALLEVNKTLSDMQALNESQMKDYQKYLKLRANQLLLKNVVKLLVTPSATADHNWQYSVLALCNLVNPGTEQCTKDYLIGKWNSITDQPTVVDRINLGTELMQNYIDQFSI
jgi:hypothetical protein